MKRSRTCLNLVELDAPAAPKRTCSLPNIGGYKNEQQQQQQQQQSIHRDSLLFFRQQAASMLAEEAAISRPSLPATAMEVERAYVVDSIVRSQGSLNEITIFEGKQFIGAESTEALPAPVPQSSAVQPGASGMSLFGGAVIGSLFDDSGDSSDYFFGAGSSDEAEEDSIDKTSATTATATTTSSVQDNDSDDCGRAGGVNYARQVSDTDSSISCARQISDASSSSSSSGGIISTGGGYSFGGDAGADVPSAVIAPPETVRTTSMEPWRCDPFRDCGNGDGRARDNSVMPASCGSPLAGGRWRRLSATTPRVRVRIISGRGGSGGARRQRSMTVPPPWPLTAGPHNRWQTQRRQQQRPYRNGAGGGEDEDGSLESADGSGLSEDAKMLLGMDRLRLFDPETASY